MRGKVGEKYRQRSEIKKRERKIVIALIQRIMKNLDFKHLCLAARRLCSTILWPIENKQI